MFVSDVAQIRQTIANEYMAAKWGLMGLASGTSRHAFITARLENIGEGQRRLNVLIGEQQAAALIADTMEALPETPDRYTIPHLLTSLRGNTEATAHLIDYIQNMWDIIDLLKKEFGEEGAHKIIGAPGCTVYSESEWE